MLWDPVILNDCKKSFKLHPPFDGWVLFVDVVRIKVKMFIGGDTKKQKRKVPLNRHTSFWFGRELHRYRRTPSRDATFLKLMPKALLLLLEPQI
ncbi:hypothetical protein Trydic_g7206 [Trypoxylus dichotomus]